MESFTGHFSFEQETDTYRAKDIISKPSKERETPARVTLAGVR